MILLAGCALVVNVMGTWLSSSVRAIMLPLAKVVIIRPSLPPMVMLSFSVEPWTV